MGLFDGIENEQPSGGGVYVLPGVYSCNILACKAGHTRKNAPFFLAELEVLESNNPDRPPGSIMTWFAKLESETPAKGDVRSFVACALEANVEEVGPKECEFVVSTKQPLVGKQIKISATNIQTKKGADFTKCVFMRGARAAVAKAS